MNRTGALAKVACPAAIAAALGGLLWLWPADFLYIYPAAGAFFLWFHWSGEREIKYIFLFLLTVVGFLPAKLAPGGDMAASLAGATAEVLALWLLFFALNRAEGARQEAAAKIAAAEAETAERLKNLRGELSSYRLHQAGAMARIRDKDTLSASAQEMGSAASYEEIKASLQAHLERYFPGAAVRLHSGAPRDLADSWVAERKIPLLVRNAASDSRFPGGALGAEASLLALPLYLFGSQVGFVRVSAAEPERFKAEDLRGAEMLCALAGVSMENIALFDKVQELAVKDGLTGLHTHRALQARLEEEILRAARARTSFSVIMCDIDHFKSYNDRYGHQAGDAVLRGVAAELAAGVRDVDLASRYGGEEFVLVLTGVQKLEARTVAEQLRRSLEAKVFDLGGGLTSKVTASFGVAEFPAEGAIASQLIRAADERLYRAKHAGRNRVVHD